MAACYYYLLYKWWVQQCHRPHCTSISMSDSFVFDQTPPHFHLLWDPFRLSFPFLFFWSSALEKSALCQLCHSSYGGSTSLNITVLSRKVSFFYFLTPIIELLEEWWSLDSPQHRRRWSASHWAMAIYLVSSFVVSTDHSTLALLVLFNL